MEAMASGVPVISTSISGIPELIEDGTTGLLVSPDDANHLCQMIIRLLTDPSLATRLADAGRRRVEQAYDVSQNTEKKASLFRACLCKPRILSKKTSEVV
jgi:glycosyltransferase involved in cell wall biosynthesis